MCVCSVLVSLSYQCKQCLHNIRVKYLRFGCICIMCVWDVNHTTRSDARTGKHIPCAQGKRAAGNWRREERKKKCVQFVFKYPLRIHTRIYLEKNVYYVYKCVSNNTLRRLCPYYYYDYYFYWNIHVENNCIPLFHYKHNRCEPTTIFQLKKNNNKNVCVCVCCPRPV